MALLRDAVNSTNGLYLDAVEKLTSLDGSLKNISILLGDGKTNEVEFLLEPAVSSDLIRAHSFLDGKLSRVKSYGWGGSYSIYMPMVDGRKFDSMINCERKLQKQLEDLVGGLEDRGNFSGGKTIKKALTHDDVARINDLLPVRKIEYAGLTASDLRAVTYGDDRLEKATFLIHRSLSGLPASRTEIKLYRA